MQHTSIIAIVDDDQAIREALEDLIYSYGYESRLFASADEYLADPHRANIDCMVVDVRMPGLSGIELQSELNKEPQRPPMIFMTSYSDERTRAAALTGGAFAYLDKPVDIHKLILSLNAALTART